ncbi:MAG: (d)CMP kinase [Lautropia sp.]
MPVSAPVLTIDGPTASGKGTIAARVAERLGFHYLDSGALYRLVALQAQRAGVDLEDQSRLARLARDLRPLFQGERIWLDGAEVTDAIRQESIGATASRIAVVPAVRRALVDAQRGFRAEPGLVADGRDMGTVIFPDADVKVFLTAAVESRAQRRHKQLIEKGFSANIDELSQVLRERDARDTQRAVAPLRPADGAVTVDSTALDIDQTVDLVLKAWAARTVDPR